MNRQDPHKNYLGVVTVAISVLLAGCSGVRAARQGPAPFDLIWGGHDLDPNGLPLNPKWGRQLADDPGLPNPKQCNAGTKSKPWDAPCTTQGTELDTNLLCEASCRSGGDFFLAGHADWTAAPAETYQGWLTWDGRSFDADYNMNLCRADRAGWTEANTGMGLHLEFDGREMKFQTAWWKRLQEAAKALELARDALTNDQSVGNRKELDSACGPTTPCGMVKDKYGIAVGMLGLDGCHGAYSELHPLLALAIHVTDDPNDDQWAIFVRNWGNQGFCSTGTWEFKLPSLTFRLPRPGASDVEMTASTEFRDGDGTKRLPTEKIVDAGTENAGTLVTFDLPLPCARDHLDGTVHLRWTGGRKPQLQSANCSQLPIVQQEPEEIFERCARDLNAPQRQTLRDIVDQYDATQGQHQMQACEFSTARRKVQDSRSESSARAIQFLKDRSSSCASQFER